MSQKSKWDYLKAIYSRYQKVSKPLRARILDEFCQVCGYNRKYAIRLLNGPAPQKPKTSPKGRRPTYGLKVILSLTAIWATPLVIVNINLAASAPYDEHLGSTNQMPLQRTMHMALDFASRRINDKSHLCLNSGGVRKVVWVGFN